MCGPVITFWTAKYVWTSNYSEDSQVCVDKKLHYGQSSMSGHDITLWTVKFLWASNYIVDSQVCVDQ